MVIENCKKIEPVVVKLCSKTKYTTFFLNTVYKQNCCFDFVAGVDGDLDVMLRNIAFRPHNVSRMLYILLLAFFFLCLRQQQTVEALCFQVIHPTVRLLSVRLFTYFA